MRNHPKPRPSTWTARALATFALGWGWSGLRLALARSFVKPGSEQTRPRYTRKGLQRAFPQVTGPFQVVAGEGFESSKLSTMPRSTPRDFGITVHVAGCTGSVSSGSAVDEQRIVLASLPKVNEHMQWVHARCGRSDVHVRVVLEHRQRQHHRFLPGAFCEHDALAVAHHLGGHCCVDGSRRALKGGSMNHNPRARAPVAVPPGFTGFRFPPEVILLAVRWYLRYGLSYRDLEELLAERGIEVGQVTLYLAQGQRTPRHGPAGRPARPARRLDLDPGPER